MDLKVFLAKINPQGVAVTLWKLLELLLTHTGVDEVGIWLWTAARNLCCG